MKNYKLILMFSMIFSYSYSQNDEYLKHIESINKNETKRRNKSECVNKDTTFLNYSISKIINPKDIIYITDRNLLKKIDVSKCSKSTIRMKEEQIDKEINIEIKFKDFDSITNKITKSDNGDILTINGVTPYGATYYYPTTQFDTLCITINGKSINIPDSAYIDLFAPNKCKSEGFSKKIEAFTSIDGQFIYIYIYGGHSADQYFAKLIFNNQEYVTRWITDYYPLSCFGCFRENFIGY